MTKFTLKELEGLSTLKQGHTDDLKIQTGKVRVWLSRLTVEDGMSYNNQVTVEEYINKKWQIVDEYEAK